MQVAPLATRADMQREGVATRRHISVVAERLRDDIRLIGEGQLALSRKIDILGEIKQDIAKLDDYVVRHEAEHQGQAR